MRWTHPRDKEAGHTKVVERFLLIPLRIGGETRWLEHAKYRLRCEPYPDEGGMELQWFPVEWIE